MDAAPTRTPARRVALALAVVLTAQLMLVLDGTVVNVALPRIRDELGFSAAGLSWVLNAYALAFGGLLLLGGRLGDVFGRLRMFEWGVALFVAASLLGGLAQDASTLVVARTLQGVGSAVAAPGILALITTTAPDAAARNRGLALFSAVSSAGASVGLVLGGALTGFASWRWSLLINVPIGLVVLFAARRVIDETPRVPGRFDVTGAVTATAGSVALVLGFIHAADHSWISPVTLLAFVAAAVLLTAFGMVEQRTRQPLLQPVLLRHRSRIGALAAMALVVGGQFAMIFLLVQYLQEVLGLGALASGAAFLPLTAMIFLASRVSPRLVTAVGPRPLMVTGSALGAVSFVWLATIDTSGSYAAHVLGPLLLNGAGVGLMFMPSTVAILAGVAPEHAGSVSGLLQMVQQIGGSLGLAIVVTVYAAGAVTGQVVPGLDAALLVAGAMSAVAALVSLATVTRRTAPGTTEAAGVGSAAA